jgi:hypothetical protein
VCLLENLYCIIILVGACLRLEPPLLAIPLVRGDSHWA